jgi:hypothetical protein
VTGVLFPSESLCIVLEEFLLLLFGQISAWQLFQALSTNSKL